MVERPLQILIALAIIDQSDREFKNHICVANCFQNADHVVHALNALLSSQGIQFSFFETYDEALFFARDEKYSEYYIHWDIGFRTNLRLIFFKLVFPNSKIFVFEEGRGTYRDDIYSGLKKYLFKKMGIAVNCGGHNAVEKIFVYSPSEYIASVTKPAKLVDLIKLSIAGVMEKYEHAILCAFDHGKFLQTLSTRRSDECIVYMSDWKFEHSDLNFIQVDGTTKILKLHPHAMTIGRLLREDFVICPNELPAEMLITKIQTIYRTTKIFHQGSSVSRYINSESVELVDLRRK